jgi:hypothetical protein
MASHPRLQSQPAPYAHFRQAQLEEELGSAVLDACFSLWREYSELSEHAPAAFPVCEHDLLAWYAELQYKTRGGGRCSQCRAPVRHALKVRADRYDGSTRTYLCLCTRCLVAEEAQSIRVLYRVASRWVETGSVSGQAAAVAEARAA